MHYLSSANIQKLFQPLHWLRAAEPKYVAHICLQCRHISLLHISKPKERLKDFLSATWSGNVYKHKLHGKTMRADYALFAKALNKCQITSLQIACRKQR